MVQQLGEGDYCKIKYDEIWYFGFVGRLLREDNSFAALSSSSSPVFTASVIFHGADAIFEEVYPQEDFLRITESEYLKATGDGLIGAENISDKAARMSGSTSTSVTQSMPLATPIPPKKYKLFVSSSADGITGVKRTRKERSETASNNDDDTHSNNNNNNNNDSINIKGSKPKPKTTITDAEQHLLTSQQQTNPSNTRHSERRRTFNINTKSDSLRQISRLFFNGTNGKYNIHPLPLLANSTGLHLQQVHASPNIYVVDNFLTPGEVDHILESEYFKKGFKKSYTDRSTYVQNSEDWNRDSEFFSFPKMADAKISRIEAKTAQLFGVTADRVEPLQVVRYKPGQFFGRHHDMGVLFDDGSVELPPKPPRRLTTVFVYLSDVADAAGGPTRFPNLVNYKGEPLDIQPKRGTAVVFCNITEKGVADIKTVHEGVMITEGLKYGLNIWTNDAAF